VKWEDLEKKSGAELFKKLGSANRWEKEQAARQLATRENAREIPTASLPPGEKPPAAHKDYLAPIEEYPGDEMVLALRGVMQSRWLRTPGTSGSSLGDLIMTLSASKEPRFRAMVARELAAAVPPPYEPSLATITMLSTGRPPNPPFRASAAHALSTAFLPAGKSRNGGGTKPSWAKFPWIRATSHPRVRLENIRALARTQDPENAMKVLYRIPTDKSDDFLKRALVALRTIKYIESDAIEYSDDEAELLYKVSSFESASLMTVDALEERYSDNGESGENLRTDLESLRERSVALKARY
ncbi:MAG: hypothetical protein V4710_06085, partial [Verrucomicrobiota bacterium]